MKDKRIDLYIEKSQPFANPILKKLRSLIHQACPAVVESIKWGMPAFEFMGPLCNMAAFKQHCVFGFWKEPLLKDPKKVLKPRAMSGGEAMGHLGRLTSVDDIPSDKIMIDLITQACKLNAEGIKVPKVKKKEVIPIEVPGLLRKALMKNKVAQMYFDEFTDSAKREYIQWINEAKTEATIKKRLDLAIEWISQNKKRNWKYER